MWLVLRATVNFQLLGTLLDNAYFYGLRVAHFFRKIQTKQVTGAQASLNDNQ